MKKYGKAKKGRLIVQDKLDVPLREVSGICLRRDRNRRRSLVAVGDRAATLACLQLPYVDSTRSQWRIIDIAKMSGSELPKKDPQIEAVASDGAGRVLLLQEYPPRAEWVDLEKSCVLATIEFVVEGSNKLAESWSDPRGSHGEGVVLLPGGHLLVAKEKDPSVLIEFGPAGASSRGLTSSAALPDGASWPIKRGKHQFVTLAVWRPDKALRKVCDDFSDLEIGPDGRLYLLSDKSAAIARLDDLEPGGGTVAFTDSWQLDDLDSKPEGLAFDAEGRAIVALDKRKSRNNLVRLEPAVANTDSR
jgi:hypothetical protein